MVFPKSRYMLSWLCLWLTIASVAPDTNTSDPTNAPTVSPAPSAPPSISPAPTITPAPTTTPLPTAGNETLPPSSPPTVHNSTAPTSPPSDAPTDAPVSPSPSASPTAAPHKHDSHHHHRPSLWRILGKTLAWLIMIALGVLLFGAIMSNRYRIYYYVRGAWYSFLRLEGTRWVLRKLRLDRYVGGGYDSSLNEIIFDNDLGEGLLMQDT